MGRAFKRHSFPAFLLAALLLTACEERGPEDWVLPDPAASAAWFGEGTEAEIRGNLLEIRGTLSEDFLRRGGSIWAESGPYFYLFNVHVRDLLVEYPDLAAVRAITYSEAGEELARATLHRSALSEIQWREALARASLAQTEGTEKPQRVVELIRYGEEHTDYRYAEE